MDSAPNVSAALTIPAVPKTTRPKRPNVPEKLTGMGLISRLKATMEVHFTPEQEARLAQVARASGTDTEEMVRAAALRALEQDAHFRAAVQQGIAQADRGEFIEEDAMDSLFEQMLRS